MQNVIPTTPLDRRLVCKIERRRVSDRRWHTRTQTFTSDVGHKRAKKTDPAFMRLLNIGPLFRRSYFDEVKKHPEGWYAIECTMVAAAGAEPGSIDTVPVWKLTPIDYKTYAKRAYRFNKAGRKILRDAAEPLIQTMLMAKHMTNRLEVIAQAKADANTRVQDAFLTLKF